MISDRYLELGFTGLGRCKHDVWNAHFPAAVLAGYYFAAGNPLPLSTEREIASQLDRLILSKRELFAVHETDVGRSPPPRPPGSG